MFEISLNSKLLHETFFSLSFIDTRLVNFQGPQSSPEAWIRFRRFVERVKIHSHISQLVGLDFSSNCCLLVMSMTEIELILKA